MAQHVYQKRDGKFAQDEAGQWWYLRLDGTRRDRAITKVCPECGVSRLCLPRQGKGYCLKHRNVASVQTRRKRLGGVRKGRVVQATPQGQAEPTEPLFTHKDVSAMWKRQRNNYHKLLELCLIRGIRGREILDYLQQEPDSDYNQVMAVAGRSSKEHTQEQKHGCLRLSDIPSPEE